ncbi:MAG: hypothetical protein KF819_30870 [Labilithrix sp.]|nr:hypothetical protein [Labilithrix sp.]
MSARAIVFACVAATAACASPKTPVAEIDVGPPVVMLTPEDAPIALRRSVVADLYFWLRTKVLEGEAPPAFAEAYAAMHDLRSDLAADPTAWEDLEVPLGAVSSAAELVAIYGELPEKKDVGGRPVSLRKDALRLARAMAGVEAAFRRGPHREHEAEIARAARDLSQRLLPHEARILRAIESDMAISLLVDGERASRPIVVTLVGDAPYPGIFAADARGRVMASFVRVKGLDGNALVETVLHESLHAMDEMTVRESSTAMNMLRAALERRGLGEGDSNVEMAVNTVTFAEAASLVKRFVDPAHRPLGESGFYTLYPPAPAIVEAWSRRVDDGEALDHTADAIAAAVTSP